MHILAGSSNSKLFNDVAKCLDVKLLDCVIKKFNDNEIYVQINESVRGKDIYVLQSICSPTNDNLMELLIIIDALKRASAARITPIIPYLGYARQDRRASPRTPISAKLVADILTVAGASRIVTFELHAGQIQGFFNIPVDNLYSIPIAKAYYDKRDKKNLVIVSPDVGGVARARALAKVLGCEIAIIDKRRGVLQESEVVNVVGNVAKKDCIIYDDIVDSAGTLCNAASALLRNGANSVSAFIAHGVLSKGAVERIELSDLTELIITDSIYSENKLKSCSKIKVVPVASFFAEAIRRVDGCKSVTSLVEKNI